MQPFLDPRRAPQRTGSRHVSALPAYRVGRPWKFQLSEVDEWVCVGGTDVAERKGETDGQ